MAFIFHHTHVMVCWSAAGLRITLGNCRNPHNYLADFDAEADLYSRAGALVSTLLSWCPESSSLAGQIEELAIFMFEIDILHEQRDVDLCIAWLHDLDRVGLQLPPVLRITDQTFCGQKKSKTAKLVTSDGSCERDGVNSESEWDSPRSFSTQTFV